MRARSDEVRHAVDDAQLPPKAYRSSASNRLLRLRQGRCSQAREKLCEEEKKEMVVMVMMMMRETGGQTLHTDT